MLFSLLSTLSYLAEIQHQHSFHSHPQTFVSMQQQQKRQQTSSHATMQGNNSSTAASTKFEEIKSCANALFEQQTRNLTKNAEMVAQIQELEQTEKELKTRLHALQQVAAGLEGDILTGSQRNAERKQALADLEAKIAEVHVQYQQLQRAMECGDQVSSCVGGFIESNTREGSTLHEFLTVASQVLHGTNPTELRRIGNDAQELRILADKSSCEVRAAVVGDNASSLSIQQQQQHIIGVMERVAAAVAATHDRCLTSSCASVRALASEVLGHFNTSSSLCDVNDTSSQPIVSALTAAHAILSSPRLGCAEWRQTCLATVTELKTSLTDFYQVELPERIALAKQEGLLHRALPSTEEGIDDAKSSHLRVLDDIVRNIIVLESLVREKDAVAQRLADVQSQNAIAAADVDAGRTVMEAMQRENAALQERMLAEESIVTELQSTLANNETMISELDGVNAGLQQALQSVDSEEKRIFDHALAVFHELSNQSACDWEVARQLDWELTCERETGKRLEAKLKGIQESSERLAVKLDRLNDQHERQVSHMGSMVTALECQTRDWLSSPSTPSMSDLLLADPFSQYPMSESVAPSTELPDEEAIARMGSVLDYAAEMYAANAVTDTDDRMLDGALSTVLFDDASKDIFKRTAKLMGKLISREHAMKEETRELEGRTKELQAQHDRLLLERAQLMAWYAGTNGEFV